MNVCSPSAPAAVGRVPHAYQASRLPADSLHSPDRTVWAIELRRDTPVARIAIERVGDTHEYRVLVDEIEVGRSDRLDLVLAYVQRFKVASDQERSRAR